jgi:hypothetical protein
MSFLEPHPSVLLCTGGKGMKQIRSFVGMDVHKTTISISVAEDGRSGPVRFLGVIPNTPEAVHKMVKQLARHGELDFCYEALASQESGSRPTGATRRSWRFSIAPEI